MRDLYQLETTALEDLDLRDPASAPSDALLWMVAYQTSWPPTREHRVLALDEIRGWHVKVRMPSGGWTARQEPEPVAWVAWPPEVEGRLKRVVRCDCGHTFDREHADTTTEPYGHRCPACRTWWSWESLTGAEEESPAERTRLGDLAAALRGLMAEWRGLANSYASDGQWRRLPAEDSAKIEVLDECADDLERALAEHVPPAPPAAVGALSRALSEGSRNALVGYTRAELEEARAWMVENWAMSSGPSGSLWPADLFDDPRRTVPCSRCRTSVRAHLVKDEDEPLCGECLADDLVPGSREGVP